MGKDFEYINSDDVEFVESELDSLKLTINRDNFKILYRELKPKKAVPLHEHADNDQALIVLEGKGQYIAGDEKITVTKGINLFVKAGIKHSLINTGDERILFFEFLL